MADYGTTAGLTAYAAARGVTLSGDPAVLVHAGTLALDSVYARRFVGQKATWTQLEQWPRINAYWPDGSPVVGIPDQVVYAAYEMVTSGAYLSVGTVIPGQAGVKRERVEGVVEAEYFQDKNSSSALESQTPINMTVENYLMGLVSSYESLPGILVV